MLVRGFGLPSSRRVYLASVGEGYPGRWNVGNMKCAEYMMRTCIENGNEMEWNVVEGHGTCHCLELIYSFSAFMHIIYCCLLGGMRVHFNS